MQITHTSQLVGRRRFRRAAVIDVGFHVPKYLVAVAEVPLKRSLGPAQADVLIDFCHSTFVDFAQVVVEGFSVNAVNSQIVKHFS